MASASERGKSNQRKGGYHEQKYGKALNELTGLTFKRNFKQRIQAEHLGDLLCDDADFPFTIESKYWSKGNGIPSRAWEPACWTAAKTKDKMPSVVWHNGRAAPRVGVPVSAIGLAHGSEQGGSLFATADLSLEDYAELALRLKGRDKHPEAPWLICDQ